MIWPQDTHGLQADIWAIPQAPSPCSGQSERAVLCGAGDGGSWNLRRAYDRNGASTRAGSRRQTRARGSTADVENDAQPYMGGQLSQRWDYLGPAVVFGYVAAATLRTHREER
jgi:hypothetical protein